MLANLPYSVLTHIASFAPPTWAFLVEGHLDIRFTVNKLRLNEICKYAINEKVRSVTLNIAFIEITEDELDIFALNEWAEYIFPKLRVRLIVSQIEGHLIEDHPTCFSQLMTHQPSCPVEIYVTEFTDAVTGAFIQTFLMIPAIKVHWRFFFYENWEANPQMHFQTMIGVCSAYVFFMGIVYPRLTHPMALNVPEIVALNDSEEETYSFSRELLLFRWLPVYSHCILIIDANDWPIFLRDRNTTIRKDVSKVFVRGIMDDVEELFIFNFPKLTEIIYESNAAENVIHTVRNCPSLVDVHISDHGRHVLRSIAEPVHF